MTPAYESWTRSTPYLAAKVSARSRLRAATATRRDPVAAAGPTIDRSLMRAAPSTPIRSGSMSPGLVEHAADVVGAGPHVRHRALTAGLLGEDGVLLEGVPAGVAVALQGVHDALDIDVTRA